MGPKVTAQEKQWQRESDAYTLSQAEEIKASKSRLAGAKTEAKKMVTKRKEEVRAMSKVAGNTTIARRPGRPSKK